MKYSEENMKNDQRRLEHLIQIVRDCEEKQAVTERTYKEKIGELEQELAEIGTNNQRFAKDYEQAKVNCCWSEKLIEFRPLSHSEKKRSSRKIEILRSLMRESMWSKKKKMI